MIQLLESQTRSVGRVIVSRGRGRVQAERRRRVCRTIATDQLHSPGHNDVEICGDPRQKLAFILVTFTLPASPKVNDDKKY